MISQPAQAGGRDLLCGLCRPFHGLDEFSHALTQGSASLHPGLYASARSAGSLKGLTRIILDRTGQTLLGKREVGGLLRREKFIPTDFRLRIRKDKLKLE